MVLRTFIACVVTAALALPATAQKSTVDPNVLDNSPEEVKEEPDPRLAERVTIDCANVRLHTALERISAETGVIVRAGRSKTDWVVRDVPVLACARDLPLGVLLRGIADANHLLLSRTRIGDIISYRVRRDTRRQKELDTFEETRATAARAAASYDWDVLAQVKDLPESALTEHAGSDPFRAYTLSTLQAVSNILAELGPEVRDRVLTDETVVLGLANAPESMKPHLMAAFESMWKSAERSALRDGRSASDPLDEQLSRCFVRVNFDRWGGYPDKLSVQIWLHSSLSEVDHHKFRSLMQKYAPQLPLRPEVPKPKLELGDLGPRYTKLSLSGNDSPGFLDTKVKVAAPDDGSEPTYSDLLRGVSRATGYSIVAEGVAARYLRRVWTHTKKLPTMFDRQITAREALDFATGTRFDGVDWYVDEKYKLIVGRDREWIKRLKALVPEKLLLDMKEKLDGRGIDLDDLEPLVELTRDQIYEWIRQCPEFPEIEVLGWPASDVIGDSPWRLYFALSPSERALAKSGDGVPLAGFDRAWLCRMLRGYVADRLMQVFMSSYPYQSDPALAPLMQGINTYADPEALPDLCIRVEKHERPKPFEGKHFYTMHVEEQGTGELHAQGSLSGGGFPIRAPERKSKPDKP